MAIARFDGEVIAESEDTVVVEGNHYFPPHCVRSGFLRPSDTTSSCSWKGAASYYTITVHGRPAADAAWSFQRPLAGAAKIKGHIAFAPTVTIED